MRSRQWPRLTALIVPLALLLLGVVGVPTTAPVQAATAAECQVEDPGTELPVILVHGFNSSPSIWNKALDRFETTSTYVTTFDYSSYADRWVTNENIGPALADRVLCLARASEASGGPGKVVVVAHSMGGLAALCAADEICSGNPGVAERLASVVTLGTPYAGSFLRPDQAVSAAQDLLISRLSGACQFSDFVSVGDMSELCEVIAEFGTSEASRAFAFGSSELEALPGLPPGVPWRNVAGQVRVTTQLFWKTVEVNGDVGDLVVGTDSAQALHSDHDLGGSQLLSCGTFHVASTGFPPLAQLPPCHHVSETSDDAFLAQAQSIITQVVRAPPEPALTGLRATGLVETGSGYTFEVVVDVESIALRVNVPDADPGNALVTHVARAFVTITNRTSGHAAEIQPSRVLFRTNWPEVEGRECRGFLGRESGYCQAGVFAVDPGTVRGSTGITIETTRLAPGESYTMNSGPLLTYETREDVASSALADLSDGRVPPLTTIDSGFHYYTSSGKHWCGFAGSIDGSGSGELWGQSGFGSCQS